MSTTALKKYIFKSLMNFILNDLKKKKKKEKEKEEEK